MLGIDEDKRTVVCIVSQGVGGGGGVSMETRLVYGSCVGCKRSQIR